METNQYSTEAVRKWLTIGALLLTLSGYALPWYRVSVSVYIVSFSGSYYIWGVSGSGSAFLEQPEHVVATWFNLPSSAMADLFSAEGIGFLVAFFFYALASLALLGGVSGSHSSTAASVVLLLLSVVSFAGAISYVTATQPPSIIPLQQGYGEGISIAIVGLLLAGGAFAIPLLTRHGRVPPSPPPPPPDAHIREEDPTLEKERLSRFLEKLDQRLVNGEIGESMFQELKSKYLIKLKHVEEEIEKSRQPVNYVKLRDLLVSFVTKKYYGTAILPIENEDRLVLILSETLGLSATRKIVTDRNLLRCARILNIEIPRIRTK